MIYSALNLVWSIISPISKWVVSVDSTVNIVRSFVFKDTNAFETMIILDGVFNALKFVKEYIMYNMGINNETPTDNNKNKELLLKSCYRFYYLGYDDRYILYGVTWITCLFIDVMTRYFTKEMSNILYLNMCLLTIPYIQNRLIRFPLFKSAICDFVETKKIFIKYTLSKTIIKFLGELDHGIVSIQNYQIFILYNCLTLEFIFQFVKNYIFITFLTLLRSFETTYYYYKAIKLSYYYNTGYLFNIVSKKDAVRIINDIIKRKDWKKMLKIENVNVVHSLFSQRISGIENWRDIYIYSLRIFSVWSFICLLKLLNFWVMTSVISCYIFSNLLFNYSFFERSRMVSTFLFYIFVTLNINDLIVSVFFMKFDLLYIILNEVVFFVKNRHNIKKVVAYYKNKS